MFVYIYIYVCTHRFRGTYETHVCVFIEVKLAFLAHRSAFKARRVVRDERATTDIH